MLFAIVLSLVSGGARVVSRMLNSQLSDVIGVFQSTFYNYLVGLICSMIAFLLSQEAFSFPPEGFAAVSGWAYLGGAVGVLFIILSNVTTPKVSAFYMTLLIFIGQLVAGLVIDLLLGHSFTLGKPLGIMMILLGLVWHQTLDREKKHASLSSSVPE